MRKMSEKEIREFIEDWTWGTIVAVDGNKPYAIEVAYTSDEKHLYFGSRPGGKMAQCVRDNSNIAFKICNSDKSFSEWKAVVVEGVAERLTNKDDMYYSVNLFIKRFNFPTKFFYDLVERLSANPEMSSLIRLPIQNFSGVCSP